ncbi:hypothetical protein MKEN_01120200 [Mycena kentingensis (nom. inval.)]|nr:hypothetical protein MKEN_01120200 [Mycena kentingensis (nom. inval.)]
MPEDVFLTSPRKAPAHRRSATSLRAGPDANGGGGGGFSLAHELAVAMMPEPSAGSKLLAEEFGIEFDEGAEGIDGEAHHEQGHEDGDGHAGVQVVVSEGGDGDGNHASSGLRPNDFAQVSSPTMDASFDSPRRQPEQDPMEILAQNLQSTDNFLSHLRHLDPDAAVGSSTSAPSSQPVLERLASDVIRRINETARDREGQVRELLEYEREFRRIAGEVGVEEEHEQPPSLGAIPEEEPTSASPTRPTHLRALSQEWETDPDADMDPAFAQHADEEEEDDHEHEHELHHHTHVPASPTPAHTSFAAQMQTRNPRPAPSSQPSGPAAQLADLRGLTTSLVASLTSVSEHAQVNGAATADAGRKLRALRNRLGGWRTEWEGAERSRVKIERWEAGEPEGEKRVDGREVVRDHLSAFERALADAAVKTQAIMAAS